ncbi:hypothetical protein DF156_09305 [Burkholderia ubonensis]|nr:hypothetical protein DF155_05460 [Burkholderia ubonensis]RQP43685.1 hypothetical protein DF156_09305 [Burkholderia ubonensis]RQP44435.1 hypothetical protein DF154_05625 [Burkholderia ubonensis]RQP55627.1 hypothetical protein DF144_12375 [Burkholderia ubonensis]RQP63932.1 hypothetical protein DF151_06995 [Burkholderia ubonensis]
MDVSAYAQGVMRQGVLGSGVSLDALNKLTGGIIQGYVDRKKKEQYAEGMAQAAQGKSLIDIENDQPWYTKLYGPDASVQGAQAFNMAAAMQDAQSQFMQAMPQLREKSPDQVRAYIVSKMGEVKSTGDPAFDSMVQQGLAEQLPRMLSTHMSQYMQFTQEQAYNGFTNLGSAGGRALQDTLTASNNLKPEDIDRAGRDYTNQLLRPDNMTLEAHQRGLRDIVLSNAQAGNWQAVRAVKEMPEYQAMPTEMKDNLEVQIPRLEQESALKNPAARNLFTSRAALQWSLQHGTTGFDSSPEGHAKLDARMDVMEDSNRKLNGDATAVYNNAQRAQMHTLLDAGNANILAQYRKAQLKQLNYDQSIELVMKAISGSSPAALTGLPLPDGAKAQAVDTIFRQATGPQFANHPDVQANLFDKLSTVAYDSSLQSPLLKQVLTQQMNLMLNGDTPLTPDMAQALQYADALRRGHGGEGAVMAYMGDSMGPKVIALLSSGYKLDDPLQLKEARHLIRRGAEAVATAQEVQDAQSIVTTASPGWFKRMIPLWGDGDLTPYNLTDGNKRQLAAHIAPLVAQYKKAYAYDDDRAASTALSQVVANADLVPGAVVLNNRAFGARPFYEMVNREFPGAVGRQGQENYQGALQWAIDQQMEKGLGPLAPLGDRLLGRTKGTGPDGAATWEDAMAGRVRFVGVPHGYDPTEWQVSSGENLGNGFMTLFVTSKRGEQMMINIDAKSVAQRMKDTFGNKPEHADPGLGLSSKNAWGWAY